MRKNSDRVGPAEQDQGIAQVLAAKLQEDLKTNTEINISSPTEFVRLPSVGKYYPEGHALKDQEFVEIRYMTAKDEDILTSKSLLRQGIALDRFIDNILINKRVKSKDLLSGDKNAILVAARTTGFGPEYVTKVTCPNCGSVGQHEFDLSEVSTKEAPDFEELGITLTSDGNFLVTLPRTNADVEIKLLSGKEETELVSTMEKREKKGLPQSAVTTQMLFITVSVNGDHDRTRILKFLENLPSYDSRYLRDIYSKIVPNLDMKQEFECSKCGYNEEVEIPITVDFFWSR